MSDFQEYSMGLMFTEDMRKVLLILKNHGPASVIGRWNGIGGHIESSKPHVAEQDDVFGKPGCNCGCQEAETPIQCQIREYAEETGAPTTENDWEKFAELAGADFVVHCFWGRNNSAVYRAETMTNERVAIIHCDKNSWTGEHQRLNYISTAPNLHWMIPFLRDPSTISQLGVIIAAYHKDDNIDAIASV